MKTKKVFILILLATIPVLFFSCDKIKDLANVNVTYELPRIPFRYTPTGEKSGEVILCTEQVTLNVDSILNKYLPGGSLEETTFSTFSITIQEPDTANFGWLTSARAVISPDASFSSYVQVGNVTNNGATNKTVALVMNNDNIRPYLGTTGFYIRVYGVLNGPVPYEWLQMYIDSALKLQIQPL